MCDNALKRLGTLGQSVWLDDIGRGLLTSGRLRKMIDEDDLRGMTSNPSIFEKAISTTRDYDDDIFAMAASGHGAQAIYESLSIRDVQAAADEFRHIYDLSGGADGFVSLEVNPHLAALTEETVEEARRLWTTLDRPNVLIKVPATDQGLPAIRRLIAEGINVNVTLVFGLPRYAQVAEAYLAGLETRLSRGLPIKHVASVASFFVGRIDTMVDSLLQNLVAKGSPHADLAKILLGQTAISCAKMAYQRYQEIFRGERFGLLSLQGARPQRLLWASTGTKNRDYSQVKYVEALIGPDTINTLPQATLEAYRETGNPKLRLEQDIKEAIWVMERVAELGIEMPTVTANLEREGIEKFNQPFDKLMETLSKSSPRFL